MAPAGVFVPLRALALCILNVQIVKYVEINTKITAVVPENFELRYIFAREKHD